MVLHTVGFTGFHWLFNSCLVIFINLRIILYWSPSMLCCFHRSSFNLCWCSLIFISLSRIQSRQAARQQPASSPARWPAGNQPSQPVSRLPATILKDFHCFRPPGTGPKPWGGTADNLQPPLICMYTKIIIYIYIHTHVITRDPGHY